MISTKELEKVGFEGLDIVTRIEVEWKMAHYTARVIIVFGRVMILVLRDRGWEKRNDPEDALQCTRQTMRN